MNRLLPWVTLCALAVTPAAAQTEGSPTPVEAEDAVAIYTTAVQALLGEAGPAYIAGRFRREAGRLASSPIPERVVEELAGAGLEIELAELAENGFWQFPRGQLFLMLEEIEWWPGRKIALFSIWVGSDVNELKEVAFTFKRGEEKWILVEKGPPEN